MENFKRRKIETRNLAGCLASTIISIFPILFHLPQQLCVIDLFLLMYFFARVLKIKFHIQCHFICKDQTSLTHKVICFFPLHSHHVCITSNEISNNSFLSSNTDNVFFQAIRLNRDLNQAHVLHLVVSLKSLLIQNRAPTFCPVP